jgi:hypothetical protein
MPPAERGDKLIAGVPIREAAIKPKPAKCDKHEGKGNHALIRSICLSLISSVV